MGMEESFRIPFDSILDIVFDGKGINLDELPMDSVRECYDFLKEFASDKVIYGINTGFGPMAQWRVDDRYLTDLQYNIIRSHSTGAGEALDDEYVRAAMVARLGTFLQARSAVHPDLVELLVGMINAGIYPFIPMHGSVGASGDLVQLAHLALAMIGEGKVLRSGPTGEVLDEANLRELYGIGFFATDGEDGVRRWYPRLDVPVRANSPFSPRSAGQS